VVGFLELVFVVVVGYDAIDQYIRQIGEALLVAVRIADEFVEFLLNLSLKFGEGLLAQNVDSQQV